MLNVMQLQFTDILLVVGWGLGVLAAIKFSGRLW